MEEQDIHARLSKSGRILRGRRDADGRYHYDGMVATTVPVPRPIGAPGHRLVPPEGWRIDECKGIWHQMPSLLSRLVSHLMPYPHGRAAAAAWHKRNRALRY
ncbi:MAG: hypothetical protein ACRDG4_01905, partial [Chloroflexota bacterium]